jgi:Uncharacterized protein conserved in bacteria
MTSTTYTAFAGPRRIASGDPAEVIGTAKAHYEDGASHLLVFDDTTGRIVDLDLRNSPPAPTQTPQRTTGGRGRPRLGVAAREVTLLPAHWEWLSQQPGGASATLRRLVDQARRSTLAQLDETRTATYRVLLALVGDRPGYEDANRALFAGDFARLREISDAWPSDVRDYLAIYIRRLEDLGAASGST